MINPFSVLLINTSRECWYKARFNEVIPNGYVLPILRHLLPNSVLQYEYGFKFRTQEPCPYKGNYKDKDILLCRQVVDMLLAGAEMSNLVSFVNEIGMKLKVTIGDKLSIHYNGLDIVQTCKGIKIQCKTYLMKLAQAHSWKDILDKPSMGSPILSKHLCTINTTIASWCLDWGRLLVWNCNHVFYST